MQLGKVTGATLAQMFQSVSNRLNGDTTEGQEQAAKMKVQIKFINLINYSQIVNHLISKLKVINMLILTEAPRADAVRPWHSCECCPPQEPLRGAKDS